MHALCGSESDAIALRLTASQAGEAPVGEEMRAALDRREAIAQAAKGSEPVLPPKANRLERRVHDTEQDKPRHKVERLCNKLAQGRRVATRYEKLTAMFLALVILALIGIMLR
ncbi:MAG: hypothetical protein ONB15_05335 [candidate division KSB1 bacterium]|nr:hypothetical protein [candidate division KSB1 bacterium]